MKSKNTVEYRPFLKTHADRRGPKRSRLVLTYRLPRTVILAALAAFQLRASANVASPFDSIWDLAKIYSNDSNPILEEFKLRGRYQGQYWHTDDSHGDSDGWEDRRSRIGFDAKLFDKKLEARLDFQSNDSFDDFYDGLVDAYLRWKPTPWVSITAGKTKPLIGQYDFLESTNTQPTFERSQIFNQLGINRGTALTIEGKTDDWIWRAGIYSNDTPSNTGGTGAFGDGEFGDFNGGVSYSLGVGYDFKRLLGTDSADFHLDWLHSDREPGDLVLGIYDDILSTTFRVKQGAATVVLESYFATGGDGRNSDVFGFYLQPTYDLVPGKLQLVGRYSYANSSGPDGVVGQTRYESTVAGNGNRGDAYHSLYGGAQYFIYGDKLKLLAGAEWARLEHAGGDSYNGFTLLTGLRFSF